MRENRDPEFAAEVEFFLGVKLATSAGDSFGELGTHALDVAKGGEGGFEHAAGRSETREEGSSRVRADARDHRQAEKVSDTGGVARIAVVAVPARRGGVSHAGILNVNRSRRGGFLMGSLTFANAASKYGERGADVEVGGGVGELNLADSTGEYEAGFSFLILLVSAHGVEEGFRIETWGGGGEAETFEEIGDLVGEAGGEPTEAFGKFRLRDHSHRHGLAVLESTAVTGDGLDCVGDGMAVIEDGSQACFFSFVTADHSRL